MQYGMLVWRGLKFEIDRQFHAFKSRTIDAARAEANLWPWQATGAPLRPEGQSFRARRI
jgi:hypothetical protein